MNKVVMDASAVLALLNEEPGCEVVEKYLPDAVLSAVNLSEVLAMLSKIDLAAKEAEEMLTRLIKEIVPFDQKQAAIAASMKKNTKAQGLSLGDRACLALAKLENLPALTADRAWIKAEHQIKIILVR